MKKKFIIVLTTMLIVILCGSLTACFLFLDNTHTHSPNSDDGDCTTAVDCVVCNEIAIEAKTHATDDTNWSHDDSQHWKACSNEGCTIVTIEKTSHTPIIDDGDCTTKETCSVCQVVFPSNSHILDTNWSHDETNHWKACTMEGCTFVEIAIHTPIMDDGNCTTAEICSVCQYVPTAEGAHSLNENWSHDERSHWKGCANESCDVFLEYANHISIMDGDCTTAGTCSVCQYVKPAKEVHALDNNWSHDERSHWKGCTNESCDVLFERASHTPDTDGNCTTARTCSICHVTTAAETHALDNNWRHDEINHWKNCSNEGCTFVEQANHTLDTDDDCTTASTCPVCQYATTAEGTHALDNNWRHDEINHWKNCSNEGCTQIAVGKTNHTMIINSNVCKDCDYIDDSIFTIINGKLSSCIPRSYKSITIPNSVTSISNGAFYNCTTLTNVTIPDSVTSIGIEAFDNCTALKSIAIPDSVTSIGKDAFRKCASLAIVTIGDGATSISDYAFSKCTSLVNVTIGDGAASIGEYAFYECTSLVSITIGDGVTSIGDYAFAYCTSLRSITIGDGLTRIGNYAFYYCTSIPSVTIATGVTDIGDYAFGKCSRLTNVTISDSVAVIGNNAFGDCVRLTIVTIGNGVTRIGDKVFRGCILLANIMVAEENSSYSSQDGILYNKGQTEFIHIPSKLSGAVVIPDGIRRIAANAFKGFSELTSIILPNSVTIIDDNTFMGCTSLISITLGNGVISIYSNAFSGCTSLDSIAIPDSVTSIGNSAFRGCTSLVDITIPDSVTSIYSYAFYYCTSLVSVTIGNGVTYIGEYAFNECTSIVDITIPDNVTSIGAYAFYYCTSLRSLTLGNGVTDIRNGAFSYCGLVSITIPNSVTNISFVSFNGCISLSNITYTGTIAEWKAITKGANWNEGTGDYTIICTDGELTKLES